MALPDPWPDFVLDPRVAANTSVRAADTDRDLVLGVLADAYAQGRLDREEHDDRCADAQRARTLGELPPLIDDLVAPGASSPSPVVHATAAGVEAQAVQRWRGDRREALLGFLAPTLITWVIWSVVMFGEFPWPAIVTAATAVPLIRVLIGREDIIAEHRDRILRKQAKRERKAIDRGSEPTEEPGHGA